jgi:hypothetical protein
MISPEGDKSSPRIPQARHWREVHRVSCFFMEPSEFLAHWSVGYDGLAKVAGCSVDTVKHWFCDGKSHRQPRPEHKFRMALIHRHWLSL